MSARPLDQERLACQPMGKLEYVVECAQNGHVEKWFVVTPHPQLEPDYRKRGMSMSRGCRIVVEAHSLRPVGVLDREVPPPTPSALGHNPYFDLTPS